MKPTIIRKTLLDHAPKGVILTVSDIKNIIITYVPLTDDDKLPYTTTRPAITYTKWEHAIQSELFQMKTDNLVKHINRDQYVF